MSALDAKNIILFPVHVWGESRHAPCRHQSGLLTQYFAGHTRPMCTLAARLVKLGPIIVTFFVAAKLYERVKAEIARDFDANTENLCLANIR